MAVRALAPADRPKEKVSVPRPAAPHVEVVPRARKSRMAAALERGTFVTSVELVPPRGFNADGLIAQARELRA